MFERLKKKIMLYNVSEQLHCSSKGVTQIEIGENLRMLIIVIAFLLFIVAIIRLVLH